MWVVGHGGGLHGYHGQAGHGGLDDEELGQIYNHDVIKRLFPYFRARLGMFTVAMFMMLVYTATMVAIPWLIGNTIDTYVMSKDLQGLNLAGFVLTVVVIFNYAGNYVYLRLLGKISQDVLYKLRTGMFDHLQRLSVPFFDRNEVGRIMSRAQNDVNQLQEFLPMVTLTLGDMLSLVGILLMMVSINFKLAIIACAVVPVLLVIMIVWQKFARLSFIQVRQAISVVNSRLQQNISMD